MKHENKTPENIVLSLLFYSFIIAMCIFAIFRAFNIGLFANGYISVNTSELVYAIVSIAFHLYEGVLILKILTNLRWYYCLPIAILYTALVCIIQNHTIIFILDILYIVNVPFIFNKNKERSIRNSIYFILGISAYQLIMSFGRYDVTTLGKYDIGYAILSFIDYRVFLFTLLLYKIRRVKTNG